MQAKICNGISLHKMHPNYFYWKAENVLKPINKLRMVVDLQRKTAVYLSLANRQTTTSER